MNRTIRTAIVTLIAAFSVAVMIAPAASAAPAKPPIGSGEIATVAPTDGGASARKDNGGFWSSLEAKLRELNHNHNTLCSDLKLIYDTSVETFQDAQSNAEAVDASHSASAANRDAVKQGCSWA